MNGIASGSAASRSAAEPAGAAAKPADVSPAEPAGAASKLAGAVTIRPVRVEDAPGIHVLNQDLGYEYPAERVAGRIARILACTGDLVMVAELDGELVGYAHASPYELLFHESQLNLLGLVVRDGLRSRGIGARLLAVVEEWAHTSGYTGIRLVSGSERADAHRFYLNHGYEYRKDQKNFSKSWD